MPQNRVQFQPGLSMIEFTARYGTEDLCEEALAAARWPEGFVCPRCQAKVAWRWRRGGNAYRLCAGCGYQCSLTAGTVMENTKLPLRVWYLAMHLLGQAKNGISALELKRQLGVSYPSAWLLKHKLMQAMHAAEEGRRLHNRVEIDDAYLGGQRCGGKPGRGSENKVPFVVAVQTVGEHNKPHRVCLAAIPHQSKAVQTFCRQHMASPVTIVSDGLACFKAAQHAGVHEPIVTGGGSASAKDHRFHGVNTYLGNLKSALSGTYRAFAYRKYAARYFAEFQFRFNRREELRAMLGELLLAAIGHTPAPMRMLRQLETPC
jgi:Zn ribbon nucleic-acid-binding protein